MTGIDPELTRLQFSNHAIRMRPRKGLVGEKPNSTANYLAWLGSRRSGASSTQKRPALANQKAVILLHDNSRPHVAQLTQQKIEQLGWEVLPHPPWSPDLSPTDHHLFLSLRNYLCNKHYEDFDELKSDLTAFFESKPASFYRRGIELLPERWANVVENNGDYIVD